MKKIQKKLVVKKKTISQLTNEQLRQVVGGQADPIDLAPARLEQTIWEARS